MTVAWTATDKKSDKKNDKLIIGEAVKKRNKGMGFIDSCVSERDCITAADKVSASQ